MLSIILNPEREGSAVLATQAKTKQQPGRNFFDAVGVSSTIIAAKNAK